jgi:hypothetical protein
MTRKLYKSAMGKTIDLGALLLQNENVRAVGNMNVNARGDRLDSANNVIEQKNRQVQRRYNKQTNVSGGPSQANTISAKQTPDDQPFDTTDTFSDMPDDDQVDVQAPATVETQAQTPDPKPETVPVGGLAAAMARTREVKQELEKTRRQQQQSQGVRKI